MTAVVGLIGSFMEPVVPVRHVGVMYVGDVVYTILMTVVIVLICGARNAGKLALLIEHAWSKFGKTMKKRQL